MTGKLTRTAAIQLCATPDVAANLDNAEQLVRQARERGAEVAVLPEAFAFLGPEKQKQAILEPLPEPCADAQTTAGGFTPGGFTPSGFTPSGFTPSGFTPSGCTPGAFTPSPILARCQALARDTGLHLILGGFHETAAEPGKSFNTSVHLTPEGGIAALYRKIHLFDVSLADGTELKESARTLPGDKAVVTGLPFGILGLTVCYDVRFPYLYQTLVDKGAIALTVPSAFTRPTGSAHWHVLLRARAIETQCYVIAPAQHGRNWEKRSSYGHSLIIDPWGEIVGEPADGDGVVVADIDPARVADVRRQLPSLSHRRVLQ